MKRPVFSRLRPAMRPLAAAAMITLVAGPAFAQMFDRPWRFSQTNRASIAFSLRGGTDGVAAAGPNILCGGGSSTAAGNSTCIVLNNADGTIVLDQVSEGSQDAANNQISDSAVVGGDSSGASGADEVLSILGND